MSVSPLRVRTLQRLMADHRYFSDWTVDQIRAVESQVHIVNAQPGTEIAHLHSLVRKRAFHRLSRIDEIPAFHKLAAGLLSPQLSLLVLDEAKSQIQELRSLLA